MTLEQAFAISGFSGTKKFVQLAAVLGITPEAIYQWNPQEIPRMRELEILQYASQLQGSIAPTFEKQHA